MARVSTYLNFQGQAEEAFARYAEVFDTRASALFQFSDMPEAGPGELPEEERSLVMHAELPATVPVLAEPTSEQRQAFELIGAAIPLTLGK
jgi:PhnB protein